MTIKLADGLGDLPFIVGIDFPEADEDALWRCAEAWTDAAADLRRLAPEAVAAGGRVVGAIGGESRAAFADVWEGLVASDGLVERLAAACADVAAACDHAAAEVEYAKVQYIAALVILASTLAALTAALVGGGISALGIPVAIATAQFTIRMIMMRLLTAIVTAAAVNVAIDGVAQSVQALRGHRNEWDSTKTLRAAEDGAIYGAVGGGVFLAGGRLMPGLMHTPAGLISATGITGGVGGVAAPIVHGEVPTGRDVLMSATSGVVGGLGPDLAHRRVRPPDVAGLAVLDPRPIRSTFDTMHTSTGDPPSRLSADAGQHIAGGPLSGVGASSFGHGDHAVGVPHDRSVLAGGSLADPGEARHAPGGLRSGGEPPALGGGMPETDVTHGASAQSGGGVPHSSGGMAQLGGGAAQLGSKVAADGAGPLAQVPPDAVASAADRGDRWSGAVVRQGMPVSATPGHVSTLSPGLPDGTPAGMLLAPMPAGAHGLAPARPAGAATSVDAATPQAAGTPGYAGIPGSTVDVDRWVDRGAGDEFAELRVDGELTGRQNHVAEMMLERARTVEPRLTEVARDIATEVGGVLQSEDDRLKTPDSFKLKLAALLERTPLPEALARIKDSVRYTICLPEESYARHAGKAIQLYLDRGFSPVGESRRWDAASGYLGLNTFWSDPASGHVFEVQFHTEASFHAKSVSHPLFDGFRRLPEGSSARTMLEAAHDQYFVGVPVPAGAADVGIPESAPAHHPTAGRPQNPVTDLPQNPATGLPQNPATGLPQNPATGLLENPLPGPPDGARTRPPGVAEPGGDLRHPVTDEEAIEIVRQTAFETDAGLAFYAATDEVRDFARAVRPVDGYVTLDLHGSPRGFYIEDSFLTPGQFALALRELQVAGVLRLPDGIAIKLLSCDTAFGGASSPAAALARELGVEVVAPDQPVWTALDGDEVVASPVLVGGNILPADPPDGTWHWFTPSGTERPGGFDPSAENQPNRPDRRTNAMPRAPDGLREDVGQDGRPEDAGPDGLREDAGPDGRPEDAGPELPDQSRDAR